jgi:hypothetical protein
MAFSGASVWKSTATNINSGSNVDIAFNQELFDYGNYHSLTVNPERITVPEDGYYHVSSLIFPTGNYQPYCTTYLRKNGTNVMISRQSRAQYPDSNKASWLGYCTSGDYFTFNEYNGTSGTLTCSGNRASQQASIIKLDSDVGCKAKNTGNQYLTPVGWKAVSLQADVYDPYNMHDPSTNNSRITISEDGWYLIWGCGYMSNNGPDSTTRWIRFRLNGNTYFSGHNPGGNGGEQYGGSTDHIRWLNAGNYVEFMAYDTGAGSAWNPYLLGGTNYSAYFGVHKLL